MNNLIEKISDSKKIYIGSKQVKAVYLGTEKIWGSSDYIDILSLRADTNQYIKTAYYHNTNTVIEIKFLPRSKNQYNALFGSRTSTIKPDTWDVFYSANTDNCIIGLNTSAKNKDSIVSIDMYKPHIITLSANTITIDGVSYSTEVSTIGTTLLEDYLFADNNSGTAIDKMFGDIYYCKIYEGDTLIRNYVPVRSKNSTNIGMLDKVNNVLYESASSKPFVVGNPTIFKSQTELRHFQGGMMEVEYLEANANQYIDIHYYHNQNTIIEMEFYSQTGRTWNGLFGSRSAGRKSDTWNVTYSNGWVGVNTSIADNDYCAPISNNARHELRLTATTLTVDGVDYSTGVSTIGNATYEDYLFGTNEKEVAIDKIRGRIYWCKIYEGETLIKDFVPMKSSNGEVVGMFDRVNNELFESASNTKFVAGPEI